MTGRGRMQGFTAAPFALGAEGQWGEEGMQWWGRGGEGWGIFEPVCKDLKAELLSGESTNSGGGGCT